MHNTIQAGKHIGWVHLTPSLLHVFSYSNDTETTMPSFARDQVAVAYTLLASHVPPATPLTPRLIAQMLASLQGPAVLLIRTLEAES